MALPITSYLMFHFVYVDNHAFKDLFLLHGTGADERDLLPLVEHLKGLYNFVGLRGNVDEGGMLRFFRRFDLGNFDQENIRDETKKLSEFIQEWCKIHSRKVSDLAFLGYSNGANMILATVFYYPELIDKAVLLHPMLPFEPSDKLSLSDKSFLVTYGEKDQMIPASESTKVIEVLKKFGANVQIVSHNGGHEIQRNELEKFVRFLS